MDQLSYCGHYERVVSDIDRIASLGIQAMRYPVIWERLHPYPGKLNWETTEMAMDAIRNRGITPIAGLVHHGSGPRYADILSPSFAQGLSDFAGRYRDGQVLRWV